MTEEEKGQRELEFERRHRREENALSIMPLPVEIPVHWYDLPPSVLPLVTSDALESRFHMDDRSVWEFFQMWGGRLIKRNQGNVWVFLGGVECLETIPRFAKRLNYMIRKRDEELKKMGGLMSAIAHWRAAIPALKDLDDKDVLNARIRILNSFEPLMSTVALSGAWAVAFEWARDNLYKTRPSVWHWMEQHGSDWDLDKPFGGKVS